MRLTVLGPTELVEDGAARASGPPKQRVLLTALAMNADRVVSTDALTERVWPEGPPASAHGSLQVYVSNLRRVLEREEDRGRPRRLVSAGDGYGLMTQGLELDVRELEQHVQSGRDLSARGQVARAVGEYDAAVALWRGDSYADVRHAEWAQPEIARVEELRLTATDERAALLLGLGRASEVATTMEAVVGANPLREASWELLVLAYARAARRTLWPRCDGCGRRWPTSSGSIPAHGCDSWRRRSCDRRSTRRRLWSTSRPRRGRHRPGPVAPSR